MGDICQAMREAVVVFGALCLLATAAFAYDVDSVIPEEGYAQVLDTPDYDSPNLHANAANAQLAALNANLAPKNKPKPLIAPKSATKKSTIKLEAVRGDQTAHKVLGVHPTKAAPKPLVGHEISPPKAPTLTAEQVQNYLSNIKPVVLDDQEGATQKAQEELNKASMMDLQGQARKVALKNLERKSSNNEMPQEKILSELDRVQFSYHAQVQQLLETAHLTSKNLKHPHKTAQWLADQMHVAKQRYIQAVSKLHQHAIKQGKSFASLVTTSSERMARTVTISSHSKIVKIYDMAKIKTPIQPALSPQKRAHNSENLLSSALKISKIQAKSMLSHYHGSVQQVLKAIATD